MSKKPMSRYAVIFSSHHSRDHYEVPLDKVSEENWMPLVDPSPAWWTDDIDAANSILARAYELRTYAALEAFRTSRDTPDNWRGIQTTRTHATTAERVRGFSSVTVAVWFRDGQIPLFRALPVQDARWVLFKDCEPISENVRDALGLPFPVFQILEIRGIG